MVTKSDVEKIFTYHKPTRTQPERYELMRSKALELAVMIVENCPESREKALAITNLQQTIMWANASIAINESE